MKSPRSEDRYLKVRRGDWLYFLCRDCNQSSLLKLVAEEIGETQGGYHRRSRHAKSRKSEVVLDGRRQPVFVKRFSSPSLLYSIKDVFRPSMALKAWRASLMLSANGFHAAPVVLAGEKRRLGMLLDSIIVTEAVPGLPIPDYLSQQTGRGCAIDAVQKKRELVRAFGKEVGRMHRLGIGHGDLIPGNVLVKSEEEKVTFVFIDNDRTKKVSGNVPVKLAVRNLVQLGRFPLAGITLTDRLRFYKAYLEENAELRRRERELLRKIVEKTRKRLLKRRQLLEGENPELLSFRSLLSAK